MVWGLNGVGDEATEGEEAAKQAVDMDTVLKREDTGAPVMRHPAGKFPAALPFIIKY